MRNTHDNIRIYLKIYSKTFRLSIFLITVLLLSCTDNKCIAFNIEDRFFGIKCNNVSDDFKFESANNDSSFQRIIVSSKTDNFCFIVYASRGNIKHEVTDKYDSIILSKYYIKPVESKIVDEYGMKGVRNTYQYKNFSKENNKYIYSYLTYDILYKPYIKSEEYFYLIYTFTNIENDSRVDYLKSIFNIEPPKISFWKTTFGIILLIVFYVIIGIGLFLFGRLVLRKPFYDIKNGKIVLNGIKNKNEHYRAIEKEILKLEPNADAALIKRYFDERYIPIFSKMYRRAILTLSIGLISIIIINIVVITIISHDINGLTLIGHLGGELALIIGGFFLKPEGVGEILWDAITD